YTRWSAPVLRPLVVLLSVGVVVAVGRVPPVLVGGPAGRGRRTPRRVPVRVGTVVRGVGAGAVVRTTPLRAPAVAVRPGAAVRARAVRVRPSPPFGIRPGPPFGVRPRAAVRAPAFGVRSGAAFGVPALRVSALDLRPGPAFGIPAVGVATFGVAAVAVGPG